jgi:uncharacterized protein (DUF1684 family)
VARLNALLLAALLGASACTTAPTAPPESDEASIAASQAFQRDHDEELRAGPLTTIAAHYLAPGDTITVSIASDIELSVAATADSLTVDDQQYGIGGGIGIIGPGHRYSLLISHQEHAFRVLVRDRDAPQSASFPGVSWFPVDRQAIVTADYRAISPREPMLLQTSRGLSKTLHVAGEVTFEFDGTPAGLQVFAYGPEPEDGELMLIPFRDATSGAQTYAAGRYLEFEAPTSSTWVLDFNRATNPYCAYSEHYNCPIPPRFNVLPFAIEAGARSPH